MDTLLGQSEAVRSPAAMSARVYAEAKRAFSARAEDRMLEEFSRDAVAELCGDSVKVTTFVPVLAFRLVRERLEATSWSEAGASSGA